MQRRYLLSLITALVAFVGSFGAMLAQSNGPPVDPYRDAQLFSYVYDLPGHYMNDHSLIYAGGLWHIYFIYGDRTPPDSLWYRQGNEVNIGHATSPDLVHWTMLPVALTVSAPSTPSPLDAGHIYAPAVIQKGDTFYMFYVGAERTFFQGEHIMMATSTNLNTWTKYSSEPIFAPDTSWAVYYAKGYAGGAGGPVSGRDPFVIEDPDYGYLLYYVGRLKGDPKLGTKDEEYAAIAMASSRDLIHWKDHGPVLTRKVAGTEAFGYAHPESPCLVRYGKLKYMFYKSGDGMRYVISDTVANFNNRAEYFLATSHASKIFTWQSRWYITSCSREIADITHGYSDRTKGLFLAGIIWNGEFPVVTSLNLGSAEEHHPDGNIAYIFPNPVQQGSIATFQFPNLGPGMTIRLYNAAGTEITRWTPTDPVDSALTKRVSLNTSTLARGVYLVQSIANGITLVQKLVVQ